MSARAGREEWETEMAGQLERLKALGCDVAQGHYLSEPLTKEGMDEQLVRNPLLVAGREQGEDKT